MSAYEWVILAVLVAIVFVVVLRSLIELRWTHRIYAVMAGAKAQAVRAGAVQVLMTPTQRTTVLELLERHTNLTMEQLDVPSYEGPTWILLPRTEGVSQR